MKFAWTKFFHNALFYVYEKSFINSLITALISTIFLFILNIYHPKLFDIVSFRDFKLVDLIELILPTYAGLFGVTIAVLSLVISLIQISKNRLSLLELVFRTSLINFTFNFGIFNIIVLVCAYIYAESNQFGHNYYFQTIVYSAAISLPFFCLLLIFTFLKISNFTKEENIIKVFLNDLTKLIKLEKQIPEKLKLSLILNSKSNELDNEIKRCVEINNTNISSYILDFYMEGLRQNPTSKVHNSFKFKLINWIYLSFENNSNQILKVFISFWSRAIYLNSKYDHFNNLNSLLFNLAVIKEDEKFKHFVVDEFPIRLKETILHLFENSFKEENTAERIDSLLSDFLELIHLVSKNQNLKLLQKTVSEINLLEESINAEYRLALKSSIDINKLKISLFYVKFINLSWLYYNWFKSKSVQPKMTFMIEHLEDSIRIHKSDFIKYTSSMLLNRDFHKIENWIWQSEDRNLNETYILDSEEDVIGIGILVWVVKMDFNHDNFNDSDLNEQNHNIFIIHCKKQFEKYKDEAIFWQSLMSNKNSKSKMYNKENITDLFASLDKKVEKKHNLAIINEHISPHKVINFKSHIEQDWNNNNNLEKVFEHFKIEQHNLSKDQFLPNIDILPHEINFGKGKILFLEENYQNIYGIDFGLNLCVETNNKFKEIIQSEVIPERKDSLLQILCDISELNKEKLGINAVFISQADWYSNEFEIINSGNFISQKDFPVTLNYRIFGVFNDTIHIIPLTYHIQDSLIIALNCVDSIELFRVKDDKWFNKILNVDVEEIDDSALINKLKVDLLQTDVEELERLKTGVLLKIGIFLRIKIKDKSKIKTYFIS